MTKQIDLNELIPYLIEGWIAMDEDGVWCWYREEPELIKKDGIWANSTSSYEEISIPRCLNLQIKPVSDWTKSLIRINESQNNLRTTDELESKDE